MRRIVTANEGSTWLAAIQRMSNISKRIQLDTKRARLQHRYTAMIYVDLRALVFLLLISVMSACGPDLQEAPAESQEGSVNRIRPSTIGFLQSTDVSEIAGRYSNELETLELSSDGAFKLRFPGSLTVGLTIEGTWTISKESPYYYAGPNSLGGVTRLKQLTNGRPVYAIVIDYFTKPHHFEGDDHIAGMVRGDDGKWNLFFPDGFVFKKYPEESNQ